MKVLHLVALFMLLANWASIGKSPDLSEDQNAIIVVKNIQAQSPVFPEFLSKRDARRNLATQGATYPFPGVFGNGDYEMEIYSIDETGFSKYLVCGRLAGTSYSSYTEGFMMYLSLTLEILDLQMVKMDYDTGEFGSALSCAYAAMSGLAIGALQTDYNLHMFITYTSSSSTFGSLNMYTSYLGGYTMVNMFAITGSNDIFNYAYYFSNSERKVQIACRDTVTTDTNVNRLSGSGFNYYISKEQVSGSSPYVYSAYVQENIATSSTTIGIIRYTYACVWFNTNSFQLTSYVTKPTASDRAFAIAKYASNGGMLVFRDETNTGPRLAFFVFLIDTGGYAGSWGMDVDYYPSSMAGYSSYLAVLAYQGTEVLYLIINYTSGQTIWAATLQVDSISKMTVRYINSRMVTMIYGKSFGSSTTVNRSILDAKEYNTCVVSADTSCYNYTQQDVSNFYWNSSYYGSAFTKALYPEISTDNYLTYSSNSSRHIYHVSINGPEADYQRTDSDGDTCTEPAPYINSTFSSPYSYYGTDTSSFNMTTFLPRGTSSYNVTLLNTDDSAFTETWITLNYTYFASNKKVLVQLDINKFGEYYNTTVDSHTVRFKTATTNGLSYTTEDVVFDITNEPILNTNVSDQTVRIGELLMITLDARINPSRAISSYTIDWVYVNNTEDGFCSREGTTNAIKLLPTDNTNFGSTTQELKVLFYLHADNIREYPFNVAFTANSLPVFDSTISEIVINVGFNRTQSFPNVTDAEGDAVKYYWTGIGGSLPFGSTQPDPTESTLEFYTIESADIGSYSIKYKAWEGANSYYCTDNMNITLKVNRIPTPAISISSKSVTAFKTQTPISISWSMFTDSDGDSITANLTTTPSLPAVTLQNTSPCQINIGVLTNSDEGSYTVTLHGYDYGATETEHNTISFNLAVTNNTGPSNTTTVSAMTMVAHATNPDNVKSTPANLFTDPNGDSLTYSVTSSPASSLFAYDGTANTITVASSDNNDAAAYTVTIEASDTFADTTNATTSFSFTITANQAPQKNETLSDDSFFGNRTSTYVVSQYAFYDPEGDDYNLAMSVSPTASFMSYDDSSRTITIQAGDNDEANYTVTMTASDIYSDTGTNTSSFTIEIINNSPPEFNHDEIADISQLTYYSLSIDWDQTNFTDPDGDTVNVELTHDFPGSWMTIDQSDAWIYGTPNSNSYVGNYTITLRIYDDYGGEAFRYAKVELKKNFAPELNNTNNWDLTAQALHSFEVDLTQYFFDNNTEEVLAYNDLSPSNLTAISPSNTTHKLSGTLSNPANDYTQEKTIQALDPYYTAVSGTFNITVLYDHCPVLNGSLPDVTCYEGVAWSINIADQFEDEENDSISFDDTAINTTISLTLDTSLGTLSGTPVGSDIKNSTSIRIAWKPQDIHDEATWTSTYNQNLYIYPNRSPHNISSITDKSFDAGYPLSFTFNDEIFVDDDGEAIANYTFGSNPSATSWLSLDSTTRTFSGTPIVNTNAGNYTITLYADDNNTNSSPGSTVFNLEIIPSEIPEPDPCYFKCTNCTGENYYECTACKDGYFLQFNQCRSICEGDYFEVVENKTCETCHAFWSSCQDSTNTNCSSCNGGYFYFDNGCYETWPDGYYGDFENYTCKEWKSACTKCFGPTTSEWTECNSIAYYVLSGESECNIPSWVKGSYLNTTDLECYSWDEGCNMCMYPNNHYCSEWNSICLELTPGICTFWDDVTGYRINEFGVWVEIWGDGLFLGQYEWDDGNSEAGDGWDSSWLIENSFDCNGTVCWEAIKPTAYMSDVSRDNLVTIKFSEPVYFHNYTTMLSNLKTNINGPSSPYTYSIRIDNPPSSNSSFTQLKIQVYGIQASIIGGYKEKFEVWFRDLGVIKDLANNTLASGTIMGYLNRYEYIPPVEEELVNSGGKSMKYTLVSMFSINLLMKVVISSSAALMWSLIHVLQAFRYILMMNIQMPGLISILMTYLSIVIGEMDEMDNLLPDVFNTYVVDSDALNQDVVVLGRFEEYGYESPYLTDLYGKQITMLTCFITFGMPTIYILKRMWGKVRWIGPKLIEAWVGIFWNTPLRTFTELYVEISLGFFLNSLNIRFMTRSGVIATSILFAAGLFVVVYPFKLLSVTSKPPLYVKTKRFNEKYGSLTEDVFKKRTLYQRAYYILFVFHRLILTGVLVYMYDYPFYQIIIVFVIQIAMIGYMMKLRPFKSELQQVIAVTDEFTIIFGMILLYFLYKHQEDMVKSRQIGLAIIGVVIFSLMKNMGIIVYLAVTNSYQNFRQWVHKKINFAERKRKIFREERKKQRRGNKVEEEIKRLEAKLFREKLKSEQLWEPGIASKLDLMTKVDRPQPLNKLVEELKTTSSPQSSDAIDNSVATKKEKLSTYQQICNLTYESVMEERRRDELDRKNKIKMNEKKRKLRKKVTFADKVNEMNSQIQKFCNNDA